MLDEHYVLLLGNKNKKQKTTTTTLELTKSHRHGKEGNTDRHMVSDFWITESDHNSHIS